MQHAVLLDPHRVGEVVFDRATRQALLQPLQVLELFAQGSVHRALLSHLTPDRGCGALWLHTG